MEWRPLKNAPEDEWIILGSALHQTVTFGIVMDGNCLNPDNRYCLIDGVTHWMPLPKPPNEKYS